MMATKDGAAMGNKKINVTELIDTIPMTVYQIGICILCLCVMFLDGFDNMIIGLAAPQIARALHLGPAALGVVFSSGHFGFLIGALGFGTLADRWGRKRMLILCALIFSFAMLLTTQITSVEQLAICRFITGLGLGGSVPNSLAFGSEYAPRRLRASIASLMWVGMPGGAALAGLAAAYVLPRYAWQTVFWLGGIAPLVIIVVVALVLPESLAFLVRQDKDKAQVRKIVSRISPQAIATNQNVEFTTSEEKLPGVPVKHLFMEGRAMMTVLIWVLFYLSFLLIQFMMSWNPSLMRQSGASIQQYSVAFSLLNFGNVVATVIIGRFMDKFNAFLIMMFTFIIAAISLSAFGFMVHSAFPLVVTLSVTAGFFVAASNSGMMAFAATSYPVSIRATGIGWAYGMGRIGAITGPMLGGILLARHWSIGAICSFMGLAGILGAIAILLLKQNSARVARRIQLSKAAAAVS
jgi:MFS transporter, AAHS family, 4-hydroxybenzoate transporter